MKIAYIMYPGACYMGAGDGSKMQAEIWAQELIRKGHQVDRINPWGHYDWKSYDIVHVFGFGLWNYDMIHWGSGINPNFVFSPIIDTNTPMWKYRLATHFGCSRLRLFSQNYALRQLRPDIKLFLARTDYEADYLKRGYNIEDEKVDIVPLSYREDHYDPTIEKEPFCLFTGTMTQPRKNIPNLIRAARKYGFPLKLVGNKGNAASEAQLRKLVGNAKNIDILGFVSDEELVSLYNRAKVFALPSLNEGVGLVALEAAIHGCNIVITNLGGPKEYYEKGLAQLVNPYDIDDIGQAVLRALEDNTSQPQLRDSLIQKYNVSACVNKLVECYQSIL
jgi:glycosyltransferase involved in cell wall biosynthesis